MTVTNPYNGFLRGLSSDTKPTSPLGTSFEEIDTGDVFISDGTYWWLKYNRPSPFSSKKSGRYPAGVAGINGDGLLQSVTNSTGSGSQAFGIDSTNGRYMNATTATVSPASGQKGGLRINTYVTTRAFNPKMKLKFKLNTTANENVYFGFIGGAPTEPTGADPLNAIPGVLFGINTTVATNFAVMHNAASGATVVDNTALPYDSTTIHTMYLVADNANTRFSWALDNFNYTHITTTASLPSAINAIAPVVSCETEEAVTKSFQIYDWYVQWDV